MHTDSKLPPLLLHQGRIKILNRAGMARWRKLRDQGKTCEHCDRVAYDDRKRFIFWNLDDEAAK